MAELAYYTTYIQRERHAMVDRAVQDGIETLQIPQVVQRLGKDAIHLMTILQSVTVPNVRHNKVHLGDRYDDLLPVVPVYPREVLYRNPCDIDFNAAQRKSLYAGFNEDVADMMVAHPREYALDTDGAARIDSLATMHAMAYVSSCVVPYETTIGTIRLQSSPVMLLDAARPGNRDAMVLLHELMHVYQLHEYPLRMPEDDPHRSMVADELESYHVEAQIIRGYQDAGRYDELIERGCRKVALDNILFIDGVRQAHQRSDEHRFEATDRMLEGLKANKIELS